MTLLELFVFADNVYIHKLNILIGISATISLAMILVKKNINVSKELADSSFFIYAYHILPLLFVVKLLWKVFRPDNNIGALLIYFSTPFIIVGLGFIIYKIMLRIIPTITKILVGGR